MLFVEHNKIEDFIIESLHEKSLTGPQLVKKIQEDRGKITKQSVYHVLKKLIQKEVVHKVKNQYYLNIFWLRKIESFLMSYVKRNPENIGITTFKDGDKVTVTFPNMDRADIYWGHLFDTIYEILPKNQALFLYHPHEWIMLARKKTESFFFERCEKEKRYHFVTIGGNTKWDISFKKEFQGNYNKINIGIDLKMKQNTYFSIAGDYIFEIHIPLYLAEKIEQLYQDEELTEPMLIPHLKKLIREPHKTKLVIFKNRKKALKLKKRMLKDFLIPPEVII